MRSSPQPPPSTQWLLLSATILFSLVSRGNSFQTTNYHSIRRMASPSTSASITRVKMSSSFQQARLAEQLRLSKQQTQAEDDVATDDTITSQAESTTAAAAASSSAATSSDDIISASSSLEAPMMTYAEQLRLSKQQAQTEDDVAASSSDDITSTSSSLEALEEAAQDILASESDLLATDGMPLAPMMTYQKYLTMQEKRVKVTIRYSAEAGLRPFYLTVVNRIKTTHPDALLEKRILPKLGSDAGENEAIFEVVVDGKTVIGKKTSKMLKVSPLGSRGSSDDDDDVKKGDGKNNLAGGRSIFVSMEKLDEEMTKARNRRRPSTMYKNKEDALQELATTTITGAGGGVEGSQQESSGNAELSSEIAEAVMRLEKLKAMSTATGRI